MKVLILICVILGVAYAQNCGFTGITEDIVTIDAVAENTPGGAVIWNHNTYNITSVAGIQHPHTRYLQGLRYASRYEYVTTDVFGEFIQTEWSDTLVRNVVVTCLDQSTSTYTFHLKITDVNDNAPIFAEKEYSATASQSSESTEPISAGITVSDADYDLRNAQLIVRSSNAMVTLFVDPQWTAPHPRPYQYQVDFFVNKNLAVGQYKIILTADDGVSADYTVLNLTVVP